VVPAPGVTCLGWNCVGYGAPSRFFNLVVVDGSPCLASPGSHMAQTLGSSVAGFEALDVEFVLFGAGSLEIRESYFLGLQAF
jgi:hypothetical protein